jgi:flagellar motor switch protein FliN/FliY
MQEQTDLEHVLDHTPATLGDDLARLHDVPVELAVEIGRTRMTIRETLGLAPGSIVSLNRLAGEPVDLLVNGQPLARGEVVVIDEEFGLRITEIVSATPPPAEREAAAGEPPHGDAPDAGAHGDEAVFASFDEPA